MKILAIDTSSKNASVAILEDSTTLIELNNSDAKTHSQKLMPMIEEAFRKVNLSLEDIHLLVCCLGPGSFTGVRIGIATVKAFADTKNIPCVGVSSLEELAYLLNQDGTICSLIDAGHGNVYAGLFQIENGKTIKQDLAFLSLQDENLKMNPEKLLTFLNSNIDETTPIYFLGDATLVYSDFLKELPLQNEIHIAEDNKCIASSITLAKIGYTKYKNGDYGDSSVLVPIYLRKSQAEIALEEKMKGIK